MHSSWQKAQCGKYQKMLRGQSPGTYHAGMLKFALYPEMKVWRGIHRTVEEQSPHHTTIEESSQDLS